MKTASKIALAIALVAGVSAASITLNAASAGGWGYGGYGWNNQQDGTWMGRRGGMRGGMMGPGGYVYNRAAGPAFGGAMMLQQFDANKDGVLTKEEVDTGFAAKVTENDKDGDNAISLEEFKNEWLKMTQNRMVRGFQRLDSDASGKITPEELKSHADAMFAFMDSNGDGKLDQNDGPRRGMGYGPGFGPRFMNGPVPAPTQPAPAPSEGSAQ
ncbi:EF-hand domain-containing protein [Cohaesibacter haloalkalitolerans]|uniref:EF-hand domain-containing protein n=1 Tax=Cohaesibacter haloalkalitolerans TaxID=1162980 RepID=UPI000E647160|nr:EF-hand domain-containing protein [Cohaesibacter haloalkalitolerans]